MNRKHLILSMALAGACFQTGSLFAQHSDHQQGSSAARIGDGPSRVGDGTTASMVGDADTAPTPALPATYPVPSAPMNFAPAAYSMPPAYDDAPAVAGGCSTGSCVEMCCPAPTVNTGWVDGGALLWWSSARKAPPLVTRHPNAGGLPVLSDPLTQVLAGGPSNVGDQMLPGFYAGGGMWLDDCQCIGVGGRVFGLFGGSQNQTFTFDGQQSLGVPFFNTSLGVQDAYLVGYNAGNLGTNTGSITVASDLDLIGAEAIVRKGMIQSNCGRLDLVGGYLFTKLDDSLILQTNLVDGITNAIANGTSISTLDQFSGSNTFHGGQLGLLSEFNRGKWSLSSGTKFGLGNMNQRVSVSGIYTEVPPNNVGPTVTEPRGFFVQSSNRGVQSQNVFAFIPQVDLKLGYQVRCNLRLDVGYSLMYFSNVALGGRQIDSNIDIANMLAQPAAPSSKFETSSLLLHGLNLGATYSF